MKTYLFGLFACTALVSAPALSAQPAASPAPQPGHEGAHHGHSHGDGHSHFGPFRSSHDHEPPEPTPEERKSMAAAKKLTAKQLRQYLAYEREMLLGDPKKATAKSKLSHVKAQEIASFARVYYLARQGARRHQRQLAEVRERIATAKAEGKEPSAEDLQTEKLLVHRGIEHESWRSRYTKRYGEDLVKLLDTREEEAVALLDEADAHNARLEAELKTNAAQALTPEVLHRFLAFARDTRRGAQRPAAVKKAGLDERTIKGIDLLAAEYLRKRLSADEHAANLEDARIRLTQAKARGQQTAFEERLEKHYLEELALFAKFREEFGRTYGAHVPDLFDQFQPQLEELMIKPAQAEGAPPPAQGQKGQAPKPPPAPAK